MSRDPRVHDYSAAMRSWGHDYTFTPVDGGLRGRVTGSGDGIQDGDFLLLDNKGRASRYRVANVRYCVDPPDMWTADVAFAPRQASA